VISWRTVRQQGTKLEELAEVTARLERNSERIAALEARVFGTVAEPEPEEPKPPKPPKQPPPLPNPVIPEKKPKK
jgi:hypothetical protein